MLLAEIRLEMVLKFLSKSWICGGNWRSLMRTGHGGFPEEVAGAWNHVDGGNEGPRIKEKTSFNWYSTKFEKGGVL